MAHFMLPIKRSSSRSTSKASAACFNQELWCFCLLLWNSIFSICLAKFTRSYGGTHSTVIYQTICLNVT